MAGTISIICRIFEVRLFKRLRNICIEILLLRFKNLPNFKSNGSRQSEHFLPMSCSREHSRISK
jgi:hypothetical protein